jgi:outer membrane protein TolC
MKYNKVVILLFFLTASLYAQEVKMLTKQEAIAETLENNFGITIAANNLLIAGNNKSLLNSGYLPSLTGNAGATYTIDDQEVTFQDGGINTLSGAETTRYNAS